jgi:hypothetical protein
MAVAMNTELLALRDAGCRCIQIEEPTLHFMANTFGAKDEKVKFMVECYNREVQGLDDVEIWIHTCWGNPNMQRVMDDTSYKASFELYLNELRGDVWTMETRITGSGTSNCSGSMKGKLPKKICVSAVSHRTLQADRATEVADSIRTALEHIAPEQLIVSSDCGFGRQGCNREIAFYKASAIAQGCDIVRKELGLETTYIPAADPALQIDMCRANRGEGGNELGHQVNRVSRERKTSGRSLVISASATSVVVSPFSVHGRSIPSTHQRPVDYALRFGDDLVSALLEALACLVVFSVPDGRAEPAVRATTQAIDRRVFSGRASAG